MKLYIKSSLNSELYDISVSSINGGDKDNLADRLTKALNNVPLNRYILVLGERGYNTGYLKTDKTNYKWLYNGEDKDINSYWETDDTYIVIPQNFKISERIDFDDDVVQVYEIYDSDKDIYYGLEENDPMIDEPWKYCTELGLYYYIEYTNNARLIYVKWKVER